MMIWFWEIAFERTMMIWFWEISYCPDKVIQIHQETVAVFEFTSLSQSHYCCQYFGRENARKDLCKSQATAMDEAHLNSDMLIGPSWVFLLSTASGGGFSKVDLHDILFHPHHACKIAPMFCCSLRQIESHLFPLHDI